MQLSMASPLRGAIGGRSKDKRGDNALYLSCALVHSTGVECLSANQAYAFHVPTKVHSGMWVASMVCGQSYIEHNSGPVSATFVLICKRTRPSELSKHLL